MSVSVGVTCAALFPSTWYHAREDTLRFWIYLEADRYLWTSRLDATMFFLPAIWLAAP